MLSSTKQESSQFHQKMFCSHKWIAEHLHINLYLYIAQHMKVYLQYFRFGLMVFNATFNIFQLYRRSQFYWWRKPKKRRPLMVIGTDPKGTVIPTNYHTSQPRWPPSILSIKWNSSSKHCDLHTNPVNNLLLWHLCKQLLNHLKTFFIFFNIIEL